MARKSSVKNVDISAALRNVGDQFRGLDTKDPASWPVVPRLVFLLLVAALVVGALWFFWINGAVEELKGEKEREETLRSDFQVKLQKAISLDELKKQREQVLQYVSLLEKQLPSKAEMDALLSDINQAGLGRSLQFELFKPGQLQVKDYYAELPISIKVTGGYHDMGAFTADIANLSRIVTLNSISIAPVNDKEKSGVLVMESIAKTFRYLDPEEIAAQRKAAQDAKSGRRK